MKKKSCLMMACLLVVLQLALAFAIVPVSAEVQGRGYTIYKAENAITVDGVGSDADWAIADWSEKFVCSFGTGKDTFHAKYKAMWAPDPANEQIINLYFLVEVVGDDTISTRTDWAGDVIRFDINDGSTYFWSGAIQIKNAVNGNASNNTGKFSYGVVDERAGTENKYTVELCHPIVKVNSLEFDIWVQDNTAADLTNTSPRARYSWNGMVSGGETEPPKGIGRIANKKGEIDMNADVLLKSDDQTVGSMYKGTDGTVVLPAAEVFGTLIGWKDAAGKLYPVGATYTIEGTEQITLTAVVLSTNAFELLSGASILLEKPTALRFEAKVNDAAMAVLGTALQEKGAVIVPTASLSEAILADNAFDPTELDVAQITYDKVAFTTAAQNGNYFAVKENITDMGASYSACLFVTVKYSDESVKTIAIADYSAEDHARSVKAVAAAAFDDRASVRAEEKGVNYKFKVGSFSFSPYTKEQNALLEEFKK